MRKCKCKKKREEKSSVGGERRDRREAEMKCFLLHAAAAAAAAALVFACVCMQVISDLTSAYLQDKQEGDGRRGADEGAR